MLLLGSAACSRSGSAPTGQHDTSPSNASAGASASSEAAGTFGNLGRICGPGQASGATARGVTNTTIAITTLSDEGNTVSPGLEHEFFDTGDAFVSWCNAAGGINGRKIVLHKRDAKLFNGAAEITAACQTDFMEVGGGTALDDATIRPRLACKLGDIPAYHVSPAAVKAPLQVQLAGAPPDQTDIGPFLALARNNPQLKGHTGIYVAALASVVPQAKRTQQGLQRVGFSVSDFQQFPISIANWRPYFEKSRQEGTQLLYATGLPGYGPLLTGMPDVGFKPAALFLSGDNYKPELVDAMKGINTPVYVETNLLPFELANQVSVVKQAVDILSRTTSADKLSSFSGFSLNAWLLWAKSATECGSTLTVDCVLQKAADHPKWDAGGLAGPVNTSPADHSFSNCFALLQATGNGFVYRKDLTQPNQGYFNCSPDNVVKGLSAG
jgi:hypothetical protein